MLVTGAGGGTRKWSHIFFVPAVTSRDDFPEKHLTRGGKNILEVLDSPKDLERAILLDDQLRYHRPQPKNGVLVAPFVDVRAGNNFKETMRMAVILFRCFFASDVRLVLQESGGVIEATV